MSSTLPTQKPRSYQVTRLSAILATTLAAIILALLSRPLSEAPPLSPASLTRLEFDPYIVGTIVQEVVIPLALIYLFSGTALFRRIITGKATKRDALKLWGVLALIQFLSFNYILGLYYLVENVTTFGLVVVITGGLLGGWRVGLGLGLVSMVMYGSLEYMVYWVKADFLSLAWLEVLNPELWLELFFLNMAASVAIWAGIVAGLALDLLGERRLTPAVALGVGIGIELGAGYLAAISTDPADVTYRLIPASLISGLAMAAVVLIVRNVQAAVARRKADDAELALVQAELRALRAQINPHFFFNALNTIRYFVRTDPETARRLLINLSEVFQRALRSGEFIPLRDEISYVEAYLALEKARLDERLQIIWSIQIEARLDHPVPTLIMQPLVENAVIHGIAKKPGGGTIRISIEQLQDELLLRVEDDGLGVSPARLASILDAEQPPETAIGLRNVDGRLRALYGEDYRLAVESEAERGTRVQIKIPLERRFLADAHSHN